jgi:hypothetical protein
VEAAHALLSFDTLHLTCNGCENDVNLTAPGLRELYVQRTGPLPHVKFNTFPIMQGLFSCLADLLVDIASRGRDAFVEEIAKNPNMYGSTRDISRKRKRGDNDGIIYALLCLANKKLYGGETNI